MRALLASLITVLLLTFAGTSLRNDVKYCPGGKAFSRVWVAFYTDIPHDPEIPAPLVAAGPKMTEAICDAVTHKDMMYRRYALAALGFVRDRRALSTLEKIMNDESELDYFRGDALQSIFRIDRILGRRYAKQYVSGPKYLAMISAAIERNEKWLTEPWTNH